MAAIRIYRKEVKGGKPAKLSKAKVQELELRMRLSCRVRRPGLEEWITGGGFYRLPALPASVIDSPVDRIINHQSDSFIIPDDSLGRKGEVSASSAESIRLWIKKWMADYVDTDALAVIFEEVEV